MHRDLPRGRDHRKRPGHPGRDGPVNRVVHPIEQQSYEILRARVDTSALPPCTKAVVERVIHASADLGYLDDLVCAEADLAAGAQALRDGAPVVASTGQISMHSPHPVHRSARTTRVPPRGRIA